MRHNYILFLKQQRPGWGDRVVRFRFNSLPEALHAKEVYESWGWEAEVKRSGPLGRQPIPPHHHTTGR